MIEKLFMDTDYMTRLGNDSWHNSLTFVAGPFDYCSSDPKAFGFMEP